MIACTLCHIGTPNILLHWTIVHPEAMARNHRLQDIEADHLAWREWVRTAVLK